MKHKRHICYTHNHMNIMKQHCCLSLILCKKYTVKKQSFFPIVSQKLQANQHFTNSLHTIYRMCYEEIEHPRVGELLESLQNGDEEPTISYRCNITNMTNGLGDRFPSFATWIEVNLERKYFKCHLRCQKTDMQMSVPTWRSRKSKFRETEADLEIFPVCAAPFSFLCHATLGPILGHLKVSKMCPSGVFGKTVLSSF